MCFRPLLAALALFSLLCPTIAQKNSFKSSKPEGCSGSVHAHRFEDLRLASVEVMKVDDCGFSFQNLEDQTVGPGNYYQFADGFVLSRTEEITERSTTFRTMKMGRRSVRRNMRGIAIFCSACMNILSLKQV